MRLMKTLGILSCSTLFLAPLAVGQTPQWAETMSQDMSEEKENIQSHFPPEMLAGLEEDR